MLVRILMVSLIASLATMVYLTRKTAVHPDSDAQAQQQQPAPRCADGDPRTIDRFDPGLGCLHT